MHSSNSTSLKHTIPRSPALHPSSCSQPRHKGIGTVSLAPVSYCTWLRQPKTYSRLTFPLILLFLAPTCSGCRKCQAFSKPSSPGGSGCGAAKEAPRCACTVPWPWRGPWVASGACQAVQSLGSHRAPPIREREPQKKQPGCKRAVTPWPESLWGARGSHHPCKHQVSIPGCPASAMGDIHLANIHAAGSQEQHQNPPANTNQIIYLLASSFKRQGKKDVKNMINLTWPKQ